MNNIKRYTLEELQQSVSMPPEGLDYLEFDYEGITFRTFGILHGITGGLNQEYLNFVKDSIRSTEGVKLTEKGMKQLYPDCGIDEELEDWLVLRKIDCITMGFQLIADPKCLWMITIDALREKLRKKDPFIVNDKKNITKLGESPYFHYLDENIRRELIGFLPSKEAILKDLHSMSKWYKAILPKSRHVKIDHPQWHRILLLERIMHIPCRSIHMLHYALAYAKEHDHKLVNLFVGETHNTDMHYLAKHSQSFYGSLEKESQKVMKNIITQATLFGKRSKFKEKLHLLFKKVNYLIFITIGSLIPLSIYFIIFLWIRS
jgi:hypothetical protein